MVICDPFYHRRALPITRIVCKRHKLSGNRKITRREREFGHERIAEKLYFVQGYTEILSVYGAMEKQSAKQLPSPRDIPEPGSVELHRRKVIANVVYRTDRQYAVRDENAVVQNDLSLDFVSTLKNLRRKGKARKRLENGGRVTIGKSIRKRDKSVYSRKEFGHGKRIR